MAILGLALPRNKTEAPSDPELQSALRARLANRLERVDQARRPKEFRAIRGVNRQYAREPAYRVATAILSPDEEASCRIVDQSHSGLRVIFNSDFECPDEFALTIPTLRFIGIVRKIWQNGREAGVAIFRWSDGG